MLEFKITKQGKDIREKYKENAGPCILAWESRTVLLYFIPLRDASLCTGYL